MHLKKHFAVFFLFTIFFSPIISVYADQLSDAQADRARLENELANLEQEIAQKQRELDGQKGQSKSLTNDISILTTQIKKAKLDIQSKNLQIKKLGGEINTKNKEIISLTEKIENEKESLAQIIRKGREIDDLPLIAFILSKEKISDTYGDVNAFGSIKSAVKDSVNKIRGIRVETESEKKTLEKKKNEVIDVKVALENTKKKVEQNEKEKQTLLSISKNKEKEYQQVLADKAKRRAEILNALFSLRDAGAIPFSRALEYANTANKLTGIRPAFLLAIITQESNLGTDQGSCYVTDLATGAGVSSKSNKYFKNVMHPTRDIPTFKDITENLGRDYMKTLVSCPIGGYGWGGAMGPAQFIPSTWKGLQGRIASLLGVRTPDPWNARDAIMASALFLTDLGAKNGSYTAERTAACRYYGGGKSCTRITSSYGNSVMKKADGIQKNIDLLQN